MAKGVNVAGKANPEYDAAIGLSRGAVEGRQRHGNADDHQGVGPPPDPAGRPVGSRGSAVDQLRLQPGRLDRIRLLRTLASQCNDTGLVAAFASFGTGKGVVDGSRCTGRSPCRAA
ncbi:MAG: hypothetical protein WDM88_11090 [Galbitalea sp.]